MVILIDSLLVGGVRFVLDKVVTAVDREMNDDTHLREKLLDGQMRLELGEIDEAEFATLEADVLARLREIRAERQGVAPGPGTGEYRVAGVEASFAGDEHLPAAPTERVAGTEAGAPPVPRPARPGAKNRRA